MIRAVMADVDFGLYSDDYATSRPGLPVSFYERLERLTTLRGARVLDLATGPGTVALELAARGSHVVGIDIAEGQIVAAKRVAAERDLSEATEFVTGRGESTGMESSSFDLVTAAQCWHWFDHDAVLAEVHRVLRPDGLLAIIHHPYLPAQSELARETEHLILEFNPAWTMAGGTGTFPGEIDDVTRGGFELVEQFCYDHDETFSHDKWRGRIRTCNGVGPSGLSQEQMARFDEKMTGILSRYPDPVAVRHRVWCVVGRKGT